MRSPFPGMDPYLEQDWQDVHAALVAYIRDALQGQLPGDLCARMESRGLIEDDASRLRRRSHPDVRVVETGGGTAVLSPPLAAESEPDLFLVDARGEPATQRYVEIVDSQTRSKVVTTIELLSPSSKVRGTAQRLYLAKREDCLDAGVNFVEIDLTRGGDRFSVLPELESVQPPPAYVGCVRRATRPAGIAVYLLPLDKPLKPIRIPLRASDDDAILQLQPLVAQAYERGRYGNLDYRRPLDPPLAGAEAEFAERALGEAGKL